MLADKLSKIKPRDMPGEDFKTLKDFIKYLRYAQTRGGFRVN